ncbi:MAG: hypothetical protein KGJ52_12595, partial [Gammaproteobacteria bacterium]|nr:hypothetical protein [Gammaproteobacteria bacterium]
MSANSSKAGVLRSGLAATVLLLSAATAAAQSVNLTAAPTQITLPDGQSVPMWGYACDASQPDQSTLANPAACAALSTNAGWSPVKITVPYVGPNTSLTINLTNALSFGSSAIPTSIVIVGQVGGGLGDAPAKTDSPSHAPIGVTWPGSGPAVPDSCLAGGDPAGNGTFCPPAQPQRVQSFATEVSAGTATALTWSHLRPGTYLIES